MLNTGNWQQQLSLCKMTSAHRMMQDNKKQLCLDSQPCNVNDVNYALLKLSEHFNVSKEVIKYRLKNENLLIIDNNEPQRIRNIFRGYR